MLRQESFRTRQLSEQVAALHELQDRTQDMSLQMAVQLKIAETEVKSLSAGIIAENSLSSSSAQQQSERQSRARNFARKSILGYDGGEVESARHSRDSSSLSSASTPSPMINSWEQAPVQLPPVQRQMALGNA
jgi:hypothetical protein